MLPRLEARAELTARWVNREETFLGVGTDAENIAVPAYSGKAAIVYYKGRYGIENRDEGNVPVMVGTAAVEKGEIVELHSYDTVAIGEELLILIHPRDVPTLRKDPTLHILQSLISRELRVIGETPLILGRSYPWAKCVLDDPGVSRSHAAVYVENGKAYLKDMVINGKGSKNGTYLNGEKISSSEAVALKHGDIFTLGGQNDSYPFEYICPKIRLD